MIRRLLHPLCPATDISGSLAGGLYTLVARGLASSFTSNVSVAVESAPASAPLGPTARKKHWRMRQKPVQFGTDAMSRLFCLCMF